MLPWLPQCRMSVLHANAFFSLFLINSSESYQDQLLSYSNEGRATGSDDKLGIQLRQEVAETDRGIQGPLNIGKQPWWEFSKFGPLCQDAKSKKFPILSGLHTSGIHRFHPKLSRLGHQVSKNHPGLSRVSSMAYRTVRKPFQCGNEHKLAFSYYSKCISNFAGIDLCVMIPLVLNAIDIDGWAARHDEVNCD